MRSLIPFLVALAVSAAPAEAQFRQQAREKAGLGLRADVLFSQMGGTIGDSIGSGFGLSAAAFYQFRQAPARLGAGASYTRFSTDLPGGAHKKLSMFALGSWHIADPNTSVVPYVEGRIGWARLDDDAPTCAAYPDEVPPSCGTTLTGREWSGLELGAVAGVDIPMTETLNIDVGGMFSWLALGDLVAGGQAIDGAPTNFSTFGFRAGVTIFPR